MQGKLFIGIAAVLVLVLSMLLMRSIAEQSARKQLMEDLGLDLRMLVQQPCEQKDLTQTQLQMRTRVRQIANRFNSLMQDPKSAKSVAELSEALANESNCRNSKALHGVLKLQCQQCHEQVRAQTGRTPRLD